MSGTNSKERPDLESWLELRRPETKVHLGVSFDGLNVNGSTESTFFQHTFASYFLLLPTYMKTLCGLKNPRKVPILKNINGLVRSGDMLLVLGRPGSGCTTFLKTISGDSYGVEVDRKAVNYQGIPYLEMHKKCRDSIYLSEEDAHFPELTLGETLTFAAEMRPHKTPSKDISRQIAPIFNLDDVLTTQVGNDLIRGLSGGEKKRTSIVEAFLSGSQIQCWDNSTRGLDSSTALEFISTLRRSADALGSTIMMSIYQASEAMYNNFDKVLLLYEGQQIYFGSTACAAEYFSRLGFVKPIHATTADFLTSLTDTAERKTVTREGHESRVPRTPNEFVEAWLKSPEYQRLKHEIQDFNNMYPSKDGFSQQYLRKKYAVEGDVKFISFVYPTSTWHQISICIHRAFLRLRNNLTPPISAVIGNTILAVVLGSVFYDLKDASESFQTRAVLIFYSIMINSCTPAFEVLTMWAQRPIVEKHARYAFYHPVAEGIASMVADLPNKIITSLLFNMCLYFITNLRRTASAFFIFWTFAFVAMVTMSMLFRMVGSLSRTYEQSLAPVAIMIFNFIIYAGFVIPPDYQVPWLGWIRWINPIGYAYESLMINEFRNRIFPCSTTIPSGPSYNPGNMDGKVCAAIGAVPGENFVEGNNFLKVKYGYPLNHLWRNLGILFAMMAGFCMLHLLAAEYIQAQKSKGDVLLFRKEHFSRISIKDEESVEQLAHLGENGAPSDSFGLERKPHIIGGLQEQSSVFHWSDVSYDVKVGKENRRILQEVSGWVKPGTLTALMGATGAGKTTLLDVLADRKSVGIIRGDICVDGKVRNIGFQRKTGYVQQADIHLPTATVREALEFSALLRQPNSHSRVEKIAYVDTVLSMLNMESYADAVIGVPGKGLNIEQRKRLTIAIELAARPEFLLFLDEPTSGLDSQTAWSICTLLRKLADNGQAILCTIHQPSMELFRVFDRLLLLGDGKTLYFGEIGYSASIVVNYFERAGAPPHKEGENPSEWVLRVTNTKSAGVGSIDWPSIWNSSPERAAVADQLSGMALSTMKNTALPQGSERKPPQNEYAASSLQQTYLVTYRIFQDYWRDPTYLYSKFAMCVGAALFNGLSFWMTSKDLQGLTNVLFSCFLLTVVFSTIDQQIIPRLLSGRALFEAREKQSKTYSWTVFVTANIIVEIVWQSLTSVFVFIAWYYPTGLWRNSDKNFPMPERAGLMFLLIWFFFIFTSTLSQALAVGIEDAQTAVNVAQLLFSLCLIFCGILVQPKDLPNFWYFMYRVVPITYLVDGMVIAGLANTEVTCAPIEFLKINLPVNGTENCGQYMSSYMSVASGRLFDSNAVNECLYCPIADTNSFLGGRGITVQDGWRDLGIFAAYVIFNIAATFLFYWLARVSKSKRYSA
ncbi:AtrD, ABC-transporter [Phaeosphaeriaceae sp. PMI808]|nr:AtrD, ABC-transporter [Phaeosphaeriaceae sp. PMI808]